MGGRSWRGIGSTIKATRRHIESSHGGAGHPLELEDCEAEDCEMEAKIRPKAINIVRSS
jgi:hypothetical protein